MSDKNMPKCKACNGTGFTKSLKMDARGRQLCDGCEGTGVKLKDRRDEALDEYLGASGDKLYEDDENFIDVD